MADIKPIETYYKGYRFRSRSEARWAVFFDTLGIKYIYEPEGYVFEDGTHYLPDFYLPNSNSFFEVKGITLTAEEKNKINNLIRRSKKNFVIGYSDMSFQATSLYEDETYILDFKEESWLVQCYACKEYQFIGSSGSWQCRGCKYYDGDSTSSLECLGNWPDADNYFKPSGAVLDAFIAARQARFEYGEHPNNLFI